MASASHDPVPRRAIILTTSTTQTSIVHAQLTATLAAQRAAFAHQTPDASKRLQALRALLQAVRGRREDFVRAISEDFGGRAREETLLLEVFPLVDTIRHTMRRLREWMRPRAAAAGWQFLPGRARVIYQPLGVAGIIGAWNYPLLLSISPLVSALAAGNHIMLKPSELAPRTADLLARLAADLFSEDYVAVVTGGPETGAAFAALPFDHLLFTGSTRVGKLIMRSASENLTPVTLELGGKSPALVHRDFPARTAAERIMAGKLYNAGQTCIAPDYVLVDAAAREEFVLLAAQAAAAMYPRLADNPDFTRIINRGHYRRLRGLVQDAELKGARSIELNPAHESVNEGNRVFPPTLLWNVNDQMAVMQEEIFGPVLPVVTYQSLDEAIAYVNSKPRPLALYYFDNSSKRVDSILARTTSGGVTVNDTILHIAQNDLPFGGVGPSGTGCYHGFDGFQTFSKKKGVFLQSRFTTLGLLRPPYGRLARRVTDFLIGR
ncbi:MAG TPA: coniferyl aldehyde dehydrogenase [Bryobacteraceae bacterium]|nr:coniferyl aldehyde dehydrogenase [Bryobacteraceae bacterium]